MVVEADLAHRHHARTTQGSLESPFAAVVQGGGLVGVDTHRRHHALGVPRGELGHGLQVAGPGRRHQDEPHAGLDRPRQHLSPFLLGKNHQMSVRVDHPRSLACR